MTSSQATRSLDPLQHAHVVRDRRAAHVEDAAELRRLRPACRRPRRQSCIAVSACIETPVAPIGWPLALRPPDGLTGSLPSFCVQPSLMAARALPFGRQAHRLVFDQLGDGEAVVRLDEGEIVERDAGLRRARCRQASAQPSNLRMSRFDIGRKSCAWADAAEGDGALHLQAPSRYRSDDQRRRAVGDERAVGALRAARRRTGSSRYSARQNSKPRSLRICA